MIRFALLPLMLLLFHDHERNGLLVVVKLHALHLHTRNLSFTGELQVNQIEPVLAMTLTQLGSIRMKALC